MKRMIVVILVLLFTVPVLADPERYMDKGDGTVTDAKTGLMWAKNDSWNDIGGCVTWDKAKKYVTELKTGGHSDWRMPTIEEMKTIFDKNNPEVKSGYNEGQFSVYLPSVFSEGGAVMYWSSEKKDEQFIQCFAFFNGSVLNSEPAACTSMGVRAVRKITK